MAQYNKALLEFGEVCAIIGILPTTGRNWKSQRRFPIALLPDGKARLQDVADWIDTQARNAA
jgi:hypothetical protein